MKMIRNLLLLLSVAGVNAFLPAGPCYGAFVRPSSSLSVAVDLKPEPEGGEEVAALSSMTGSKLKNMGENSDKKSDDGKVYDFWLLSEAEASLIKQIRTQILKDAAKKANFPGFRKGQVPPWAQPQITAFAVQEALIKTVEAAVGAYGLKALPGSAGEIEVQEEVSEMAKGWKDGMSLSFTTKFSAIFDPAKERPDEKSDTIDVQAEEVETEST